MENSWKKEFLINLYKNPESFFNQIQKMPHANFSWIIKNFYLYIFILYPTFFLIKAIFQFSSLKTIVIKGFIFPSAIGLFFLIFLMLTASIFEKASSLWNSQSTYNGAIKLLFFSFYPFFFSFLFLTIPFAGFILSAFLFFYGVFMTIRWSSIFFPMDQKNKLLWFFTILGVYFLLFVFTIAGFFSYEILIR